MIKRLTSYLSKITGLTSAELGQAWTFQFILFLLITTLLLLKPTINSVFISALGPDALPLGYLVTAVVAVIGANFYQKAVDRLQLKGLITGSLVLTIVIILAFGLAFQVVKPSPVLLYSLYVFVSIYGLLTTSQFWLMTNQFYSVREAKNIFGFIGSGGIIGGIIGGYLTSYLSKLMPTENILFVAAGLLLICIPLYQSLWKRDRSIESKSNELTTKAQIETSKPWQLIKGNELLYAIAVMTGLSVFAAKMVDYQYSEFASRVVSSKEELSSFFGIWLSNISIVSLIIQLFFTKIILKRLGVTNTLFIMPLGLLLGSFLMLILPELWVAIFIKMVDGSLKQSVNKTAKEMVIMPVPAELRKKTKTYIDVVIDSLATGLAGIILYLVVTYYQISLFWVSIITIAFILSWLYYITRVKKAYRESFRSLAGIKSETVTTEKYRKPITQEQVEEIMDGDNPDDIDMLLDRLYAEEDSEFTFLLVPLLSHQSEEIRQKACRVLTNDKNNDWSEEMSPLLNDPNMVTAELAFQCKVENMDAVDRDQYIQSSIGGEINRTFLLALEKAARDIGPYPHRLKRYGVLDAVDRLVKDCQTENDPKQLENKRCTLLRVIGFGQMKTYYPLIEEAMKETNSFAIKLAAMESAARTQQYDLLDYFMPFLDEKTTSDRTIDAIKLYGEKVMDFIIKKVESKNEIYYQNVNIPPVFASFSSQNAVRRLFDLSYLSEYEVAMSSLEAINRLQEDYQIFPSKKYIRRTVKKLHHIYQITLSSLLTLNSDLDSTNHPDDVRNAATDLRNLLFEQKNRPKEYLLDLLNLAYPDIGIDSLEDILREDSSNRVNYAIEYLDERFDPQLRLYLEPLLLTELCDDKSDLECEAEPMDAHKTTDKKLLSNLLRRNNAVIRHATLKLISATKDKSLLPLLKKAEHYSYTVENKQLLSEVINTLEAL